MEERKLYKQRYVCEYIWIGGKNEIRSKTKVIELYTSDTQYILSDFPIWNYDGSSTWQADSDSNTEVILKPCAVYRDPLRTNTYTRNVLILCDTYDSNDEPLSTNTRYHANMLFDRKLDEIPWFGIEQEYFIEFNENFKSSNIFIMPREGEHYCGKAAFSSVERKIVEEHLFACIKAGLLISGINAEVTDRQWEFQIGPCVGISAGDQMIIARYLLERIAEKYDAIINYYPKPYLNVNGSGCHVNFSTLAMRSKNGMEIISECMNKLELAHKKHIQVYGIDNNLRLTGTHETSSCNTFSWGVGTRNTSIRIPNQTVKEGCGYFEDRRPASNIDPYVVTSIIFETCCL